ncbi:MAG: Hpt domain-containing protein [Syntrophorhabdaceae bacterium]|nr:Hpt domain-containing protein [Syntrophorhabdaceae bacterium]
MDGFEATRRIKGIDSLKDLPIIALTAHAIKGDREKCLSAGMNDYITKPINSEEFYKTLMKWIKPKKMMTSTSEDFIKVSGDEIIELPTKIEGIDIDKALKRMEENKKMYLNLLRIFLKEYENEINRIKQLHDDNDVSSLTRIVHSLKGDAGTIGAFNLQKQAETIEKTIKAGGYIADTIAETTSELQIVLNSIKKLLKTIDMGAQAHITQVPDKNIEDITHHINRLYKMLNEGNFAAKDLFEELKVHISNISQIKGDLTQLEEKIYSFDMDGAINVLCNIADKLQIRGIG